MRAGDEVYLYVMPTTIVRCLLCSASEQSSKRHEILDFKAIRRYDVYHLIRSSPGADFLNRLVLHFC